MSVTSTARPCSALVLLAAALAGHPAQAQNLVTNSGFETGSLSSWSVTQNGSNVDAVASLPHTGGYCALFSNPTSSVPSGGPSLGPSATAALSQSLATGAGSTYTLTFYALGAPGNSGPTVPFTVAWGTSGTASYFTQTFAVPAGAYTPYTVSGLNASDPSTPLSFSVNFGPSDNPAIRLDDVSVTRSAAATPVPEPSTVAAFAATGLGAGVLMLRARKRQPVA